VEWKGERRGYNTAMISSLLPIIALLAAGIASVLFLPRLGMSPIVGFLLTGILFGDSGLHLMPHSEMIHLLAELGVVFLLFEIGLHFSLRHVWSERKGIFVLGPAQVLLTAVLLYLAFQFFALPPAIAVVLSLTLALSSTAVVTQVLSERGMQGSPLANTTTAVLIFQDICAIFLLILAGSLSSSSANLPALLGLAALKCALSIGIALLIGKYLLKPVFSFFARYDNGEAFTMIALFIVLLTGLGTGLAGLSLTLGAFLAGMIISESQFRHIIQTEVKPFRNLLLSFFFVTVGLSIDLKVLLAGWGVTLGLTLAISAIKMVAVFVLFLLFKEGKGNALQQAGLLFQGSEFVFVIIGLPALKNVLPAELNGALVASVALSMAGTAFVFDRIRAYNRKEIEQTAADYSETVQQCKQNEARVIIIGMNRVGETVARALEAHGISYIIVERDYDAFACARENGFPVVYGDKADLRLWESIGIEQYKTMVIAAPELEVSRMYADLPEERYLHLERFLAVDDEEEALEFQKLNYARVFVNRGFPPGLELAEALLTHLEQDRESIQAWMQRHQRQHLENRAQPML